MCDNNNKSDESECTSSPDIDESLFNDEKKESDKPELSYEVLSIEEIVKLMQECIEEVKGVIGMSSAVIRSLLKHFKWDTNKLLEELCEKNEQKLFEEIGILPSTVANEAQKEWKRARIEPMDAQSDGQTADQSVVECGICMRSVSAAQMFGLDCNHAYCRTCWDDYLTTKIVDYGDINVITCASSHCKVIVDDDVVLQLLTRETARVKYYRLTTNSFVESNALLRWCPRADCCHAFRVRCSDAQAVKCVCGTTICFKCGDSVHEPIECELLRQWNRKSAGNNSENIDGQTANWIVSNTKECPKCRTSIEKNGGCNHMTCKSVKCKYEFCWVCLESWSAHGTSYYSCNRYNDERAKMVKESQSEQRKALEKYMFYWTRFMNHKQSLKFESQICGTINSKMAEMQDKYKMAWIEVQFMREAVQVLCDCRRTLMYTYVFAYYNQSTPQLVIFEDNQRDLQRAVERLSEYLEQTIQKERHQNIKANVLDLSHYCESRRKALIQHIYEGHEREWWAFTNLNDI